MAFRMARGADRWATGCPIPHLLVLMLFALQLTEASVDSAQPPEVTNAQIVPSVAYWDAATPGPFGTPSSEGGWLSVYGALRPPSIPKHRTADQPVPARLEQAALSAYALLTLAVRPLIDAAKDGRHTARATTLPPPAL